MKKSTLSLVILATTLSFSSLTTAEEAQTINSTQETLTTSNSTENVIEFSEVTPSNSTLETTEESDAVASQEENQSTSVATLKSNKELPKQGPYITDGSYVYVTKKNYDIWQNFNWKNKNNTSNLKAGVYQARGRYEHENGNTYYSLFDSKGTWIGYLNAKATKKTVAQGDYIVDGRYVEITNTGYEVWSNFNWKLKDNTFNLYSQKFKVRGRYEHFNGSTYYSLYDNSGKWAGYLNSKATKTTGAQGIYIVDGRKVKISKRNYDIWQNFDWKKKSNTNKYYGQELTVKNRYNHFNGNTYYSLFDSKNNWVGYLNNGATTVVEGEFGARPTTQDELDLTYENWMVGNLGLTFPTYEDANKYFNKTGYNAGNIWDVKMKRDGKIRYTISVAK